MKATATTIEYGVPYMYLHISLINMFARRFTVSATNGESAMRHGNVLRDGDINTVHRKAFPQHSVHAARTNRDITRSVTRHMSRSHRVASRQYYCEVFDAHRTRLTPTQFISLEQIKKIEGKIDSISPWKFTICMSVPACFVWEYFGLVNHSHVTSMAIIAGALTLGELHRLDRTRNLLENEAKQLSEKLAIELEMQLPKK